MKHQTEKILFTQLAGVRIVYTRLDIPHKRREEFMFYLWTLVASAFTCLPCMVSRFWTCSHNFL